MSKKILYLLPIIFVFILSGCGKQPAPQNTKTENTPPDTVMINHFIFEPASLTVDAGTTVTWKHNDSVAHTIVSPNLFESKTLNRGDVFTFDFATAGEYDYYCSIHPSMKGKIIVK